MMCLSAFIIVLIIKLCLVTSSQYQTKNTHEILSKRGSLYEYETVASKLDPGHQQERHYFQDDEKIYYKQQETEVNTNGIPFIEIDMSQCPQECVCQYAHLNDLPISRWINAMQKKLLTKTESQENYLDENETSNSNKIDSDELLFSEGFDNYKISSFIKQATCIIQEDTETEQLIKSLPNDMQALVLLYTGVGKNKMVNSSILKPLHQLTTLEVRGAQDRGFRFLIDAPLSFLQYVNFESITLIGSEISKKPKNLVHPKEVFDYKPNIELLNSLEFNIEDKNIKHYDKKLLFELQRQEQEELEIVPYEVYKEEVKKAQMPSFYGWKCLKILRIQSCGLRELSWEMLMGLEELQHLSLERNDISVVPPFALSGATQLKTLSVAHNLIHDLHYRSLAGLFELRVLDLSDNNLTKLTELSFPPLPKLERIDFRRNPIRYIFPATFWVMNQTKEMYFGSTEASLELWGNQPFKKLAKLKILEIYNVTIRNLDQNIFKDLISLQKLKLQGELHSIEFDAFAGAPELNELDLSGCRINDISMDAFIGCKNLKIINLSNNNISYMPTGIFDDQKKLEEVYLNDNQLRTLPKTFFQQKRLVLARLHNNPWKCSCDMFNWKAKITNQEKTSARERCINDYESGNKLSCRNIKNFRFNKKLTPRCDNFKGRSVYYIIRKQMQCNKKYIDNRTPTHQKVPHWLKVEENMNKKVKYIEPKGNSRMAWQLENTIQQSHLKKSTRENSLMYHVFRSFAIKNNSNNTANSLELSNDT